MKIDDLALLDALFQEPNLTEIAQRFHLSQSNLSKILKRVETELGFALFERKGFHGLKPTAQGLLIAERVGRFTRAWHDTLTLVKTYDQRRIDVKVTGPELYMRNVFLRSWFASRLPERFRLTYAEARIDQISLAAQAGDLDLVITPSPFELLDWTPTPVFQEEFSIFTSARSGAAPTRADLQKAEWIAYHAVSDKIQGFFHEHQISPAQVVAYIEDTESILDILETNPRFLSLLPSHAKGQHRKLRRFPWKKNPGQTLYLMVRRENPPARELARELKELLQAQMP